MKNVTELRNELSDVFFGLKNGTLEWKVAKEMNNSAGKMINSSKVQLEYHILTKDKPNIAFLK